MDILTKTTMVKSTLMSLTVNLQKPNKFWKKYTAKNKLNGDCKYNFYYNL